VFKNGELGKEKKRKGWIKMSFEYRLKKDGKNKIHPYCLFS